MNGPNINTLIGLAYIVAAPAFILWTYLSVHVWRVTREKNVPLRRFLRDYRLAVTSFLASMVVFVIDLVRLRYGVSILGASPNSDSFWVLATRWWFAVSTWWATLVLYGTYFHRVYNRIRGRNVGPPTDPYIPPEPPGIDDATKERQRSNYLISVLEREGERLSRIAERMRRDEPLLLPDDPRRKEHIG